VPNSSNRTSDDEQVTSRVIRFTSLSLLPARGGRAHLERRIADCCASPRASRRGQDVRRSRSIRKKGPRRSARAAPADPQLTAEPPRRDRLVLHALSGATCSSRRLPPTLGRATRKYRPSRRRDEGVVRKIVGRSHWCSLHTEEGSASGELVRLTDVHYPLPRPLRLPKAALRGVTIATAVRLALAQRPSPIPLRHTG